MFCAIFGFSGAARGGIGRGRAWIERFLHACVDDAEGLDESGFIAAMPCRPCGRGCNATFTLGARASRADDAKC